MPDTARRKRDRCLNKRTKAVTVAVSRCSRRKSTHTWAGCRYRSWKVTPLKEVLNKAHIVVAGLKGGSNA